MHSGWFLRCINFLFLLLTIREQPPAILNTIFLPFKQEWLAYLDCAGEFCDVTNKPQALPFSSTQELSFTFYSEQTSCDRKECKRKHKGHKGLISSPSFQHILGRQLHDDRAPGSGTDEVNIKQWKKEQASGCCTADVCLWISCTTAKKGQICSFFHCLVKIEKIAMHLRDEEVPRGIQTVDPIWIIQEEAPELVYTLIRPSNVVQFFTLLTLIRIRRVSNNCVGNVGKLKT